MPKKCMFFAALCLLLACLCSTGPAVIGGAAGPASVAMAEGDVAPSASPTPIPTAAPVENADFAIDAVTGYDGLLIMGRWNPCIVTVTNQGSADFDGIIGVNVFFSQTEYNRYELPLTLAPGATKQVSLPIRPQTRQDMYAFELVQGDRLVAEKRVVPSRLVAPETVTIGLLSDDPAALTYMDQRANNKDTLRGETWATIPLDAALFPSSFNQMESFAMLVVDGVDLRVFSPEQQEALSSWLLAGGVAILSGGAKAAMGYPFFEQWTGLKAGKLTQAGDITPALSQYMAVTAAPADAPVWLNEMPAEGALIKAEEAGLATLHQVGGGMIYTVSFDLGGKPVSTWPAMASFWPRMLRQSSSEAYMTLLNTLEQYRYGGSESYRAQELIGHLGISNEESGIPLLLLIALYLVLVGFGGYLILKRLDKREWLWAAAPLAALSFTALFMFMSGRSQMNDPVALTASRILLSEEGARINTYVGVAMPGAGELSVETDRAELPTVLADTYFYDVDLSDAEDKYYRPLSMRQRYHYGEHPSIGFLGNDAWEAKMLMTGSYQGDIGDIEATLWMEADGVHGEIFNNTDALLEDCLALTSFGFCKVGDLLPGERAQIEMLLPSGPLDLSRSQALSVKPNILYAALDVPVQTSGHGYYSYNDLMSYFRDAAIADEKGNYSKETSRKNAMLNLFESDFSFYGDNAGFYFFAFSDAFGQIGVKINGQEPTRKSHATIIAREMAFDPIGPTGEVLFPQTLIPVETVFDMGESEKPRVPGEADGESQNNNLFVTRDTYINLGAPVAMRFVLPEHERYTIEKMTVYATIYDSIPTLFLYNNDTEGWDEQPLITATMTGDEWAPYIDTDGGVYIRFVPAESANRYGGMQRPVVTLKGKVK